MADTNVRSNAAKVVPTAKGSVAYRVSEGKEAVKRPKAKVRLLRHQ
jgi:hypothetical protein